MTKVAMHKCDFCEQIAERLNEGVVRLTDDIHEVRFEMCDDCLEQYLNDLEEKPRRGRTSAAQEAQAA